MIILFTVVHIIVCVILVLVVLLQSGKAGDLSTAFGGAGSQTAFGTRSAATLLTKATTVAAVLFMVTSLGLAIMSIRGSGGSIMEGVPTGGAEVPAATQTAPGASGPAAESAAPEGQPAQPESQPPAEPAKPPENQ